jgi:hypothetical protein
MMNALTTAPGADAWTGECSQCDCAPSGGDWVGRGASPGNQAAEHTHSTPTHATASWGAPQLGGLAAPLLARVDGVRPAGAGKWYGLCPAHDDHSPSLAIREASDRLLLHCWAGCAPDAVLAAVGLAWRDLYRDPWQCAAVRPNEGARDYARRTLAATDPLDLERRILAIAAADLRAGRSLTAEDRARAEVARERLAMAGREVRYG